MNWLRGIWSWWFVGALYLVCTREQIDNGFGFVLAALMWPLVVIVDIWYWRWGRYEIRNR